MIHKIKRTVFGAFAFGMICMTDLTVFAEGSNTDEFIDSFIETVENNEEVVATPSQLMVSHSEEQADIIIEDEKYPTGTINYFNDIKLEGTISSDSKIEKIEYKITDKYEKITYASYKAEPGKCKYIIPDSLKEELNFDNLKKGNYKLLVIATNKDQTTKILIDERFVLNAVKSQLTSNVKLSDTTIYKGYGSFVTGKITSNYKITKVTVEIVGTDYSITVKPNVKSYEIPEKVDAAMRFDKLDKGNYVFKVTARDSSGKEVIQKINVKVKTNDFESISHDIVGVKQRTRSDCAFASMATCELYHSMNGNGALGSLLAKSNDPYTTLKARNGNSTYGNWSVIGYEKVYSNSLTTLYNALKKGPVIVHKSMHPGSHYSVVYAYKGSNDKIYAKNFMVFEVTTCARMDLGYWLTSYSSYNINGPGTFDHMVVKK